MTFWIINGPNLNMLGVREPEHYGSESYSALCQCISEHCAAAGICCEVYQSNHEGDLVDKIQQAYFDKIDGIIINPGAYTHTSIALLDALRAVRIPTVEVHISKLDEREAFRQTSYIRPACIRSIIGHGINGYIEAVDCLSLYCSGINFKDEGGDPDASDY